MMGAVGSVAAWLLSGSCPCSVIKDLVKECEAE